jgi:hypothetical protein
MEELPKKEKTLSKDLQIFLITISVFALIAIFALALNWIQTNLIQKNSTKTSKNATAEEEDVIVNIDSVWQKYTNKKLGFNLNIPKTMIHSNGSCQWVSNNDHSYRPLEAAVPVKVFKDTTTIYISSEYYYKLTGETVEGNTHYFAGCQKIDNSVHLLKDTKNYYEQFWPIKTASVTSNAQLESYIKQNYGQGCSLGEKKVSNQDGVYDVSINTDGKPLDTTACPINFAYQLKYYTVKNTIASWNTGQACTFRAENNVCRDEDVIKSFKFN